MKEVRCIYCDRILKPSEMYFIATCDDCLCAEVERFGVLPDEPVKLRDIDEEEGLSTV